MAIDYNDPETYAHYGPNYSPRLQSLGFQPNHAFQWLGDPSLRGNLTQQDFESYFKATGGQGDNMFRQMLGMETAQGGALPHGQYGAGDFKIDGDVFDALSGYLQKNDPALWNQFVTGYQHNVNDFNDWTGIALGALMTAGAASGAMAGAGAAGAGGAGSAGAAAGAEYGLGSAALGSGIGGGSAGLGVTGSGAVGTVGGIGTAGGTGAALGSGVATGSMLGGSGITGLLSQIPSSVISQGAQAVLKYIGMNKMGDAYTDAANQFFSMGEPFRNLLLQSYSPGFDLYKQPGYGDAFKRAADISTRQWSTRGNPANNPGIQGGILNDVWNQSYIPSLNSYRAGLGGPAGLGVGSGSTALLNSIPYSSPGLSAGGDFLGGLLESLSPTKSEDSKNISITIGGVPYRT